VVNTTNETEKKRVAKPMTNAAAPNTSKNVDNAQLNSGETKLNGNGKVILANQFSPVYFAMPASPNSQAKINLNTSCGNHVPIDSSSEVTH
tara:strand:+ start:5116 stop:5388 length:273 start_codon:yes stop_codon:yes gene_type:complete